MQITLNQDEIEDAIRAYVHQQLVIQDNQEVTIDLKAGRGDNGFTATLDIRASTAPAKKKPATRSAPSKVETKSSQDVVPKADTPTPSSAESSTPEPLPEPEVLAHPAPEEVTVDASAENGKPSQAPSEASAESQENKTQPSKGSIFSFDGASKKSG